MSVDRRDQDYTYFRVEHSRAYRKMHKLSLEVHDFGKMEDARKHLYVEGLIEVRYTRYSANHIKNIDFCFFLLMK